jgi:putative phosphoribosyl transferase
MGPTCRVGGRGTVVGVSFRDRADAGRRLGAAVAARDLDAPVVLALPRGGVPVAAEVARALQAPLDVILVRKLGAPGQPELAMGAIGEGGVRVLNDVVIRATAVTASQLSATEEREQRELERRAAVYRRGRAPVEIAGRTVVIVDDGLATGATARAAIAVARAQGAARVVLAVPVAPPDAVVDLAADADEIVTVETPARLWAIGAWYDDFRQTDDAEVERLLNG